MLSSLVNGTITMKSAATALKTSWHTFGRDMRHDWQDWSPAERLTVKAMGISSILFAGVYMGLALV